MKQIVVFCLENSYFRGKPIKIYELTSKILTYGKLFPRIQFLKPFFFPTTENVQKCDLITEMAVKTASHQ